MTDPSGASGGEPTQLQDLDELDRSWAEPDPWAYDATEDDELRARRLLGSLPQREYERTLDIGCGNAFVTSRLPGTEVVGTDVSAPALEWARERVAERPDAGRFRFEAGSIFDLDPATLGTFDLIVITGVLYPQYIGSAFTAATEVIRALARKDAVVASVHIDDWSPHRFPWTSLVISIDGYREYTHRLEIFQVDP